MRLSSSVKLNCSDGSNSSSSSSYQLPAQLSLRRHSWFQHTVTSASAAGLQQPAAVVAADAVQVELYSSQSSTNHKAVLHVRA
jgi:hypothetical protein